MREIKFRGKLRNSHLLSSLKRFEWIYGGASFAYNEVYIHSEKYHNKDFCVIPETVGQFTGLKDKNGKEIYEGDIVKPIDKLSPIKYVVKYERAIAGFLFFEHLPFIDHGSKLSSIGSRIDYTEKIKGEFIEIVGNIHDNPELIK